MPPTARICPRLLIWRPCTNNTSCVTGIMEFRSCNPVGLVHRKARAPSEVCEAPTTCPESLIPRATAYAVPSSDPRLCMPPSFVQRKARLPDPKVQDPTTWPVLLTRIALHDSLPCSIPRSTIPLRLVHRKGRVPDEFVDIPTTCPALLMA